MVHGRRRTCRRRHQFCTRSKGRVLMVCPTWVVDLHAVSGEFVYAVVPHLGINWFLPRQIVRKWKINEACYLIRAAYMIFVIGVIHHR